MKISIEYCAQWNYKPRALRVKDRLVELYNAEVDLVAGGGGVFEITQDDRLLFSKKAEGRFPTDEELQVMLDGSP